MEMTPRENYLAVINHEEAEWVPNAVTDMCMVGGFDEAFDVGPAEGGADGFGVEYVRAGNMLKGTTPDTRKLVVPDIVEWERYVTWPDFEKFDWKGMVEKQTVKYDPEKQVKDYWQFYGPFQRVGNLAGFEEALVSMVTDPEDCGELMAAITDYRISVLPYIKEYVDPDIYTLCDDVAQDLGLFMSREAYREHIFPHHKRMLDAVKEYDMIPAIHCCAKGEDLVEEFIEAGAVVWEPCHPVNDIEHLLDAYGDRMVFVGGYTGNGVEGSEAASAEQIVAEVDRCYDQYAPHGSYIFLGTVACTKPENLMAKMGPLVQESVKRSLGTPAIHRPKAA